MLLHASDFGKERHLLGAGIVHDLFRIFDVSAFGDIEYVKCP